jgi:hypothetical protein
MTCRGRPNGINHSRILHSTGPLGDRLDHKGRVTSLLCPQNLGSRHVRIASAASHMGAGAARIIGAARFRSHYLCRAPCVQRIVPPAEMIDRRPTRRASYLRRVGFSPPKQAAPGHRSPAPNPSSRRPPSIPAPHHAAPRTRSLTAPGETENHPDPHCNSELNRNHLTPDRTCSMLTLRERAPNPRGVECP